MPVLLLAQGDVAAKDLLRRAIEARYGLRPPAIENLQVDFKGRARVKLGPIVTWVPVEATARFQFPTSMRWDFTVRPIGVEVQRGIEAFDGMFYRHARGNQAPKVVDDPDQISSMQSRLWAIAAVLLTPLGEHFVKLNVLDEDRLGATNTRINNNLELALRANRTLETVSMDCLNPDTNRQQHFVLQLSEEQISLNDFMLPRKISAFWDGDAFYEMEPVGVESDPVVDEAVFTLA